MKIIFLGDSIATQQTGIHYYGQQLVQSALEQYPDNQYSIVLPEADGSLGMEEILVPLKGRGAWYLRYRQLVTIPKILRKLKPDMVVELAHFGPFSLPSDIKRVTVIHDLTPLLFPEFHSLLSTWMHRLLLPQIIKRADYLLVNSLHTGKDLMSRYPSAKVKTHTFYPKVIGPQKSIPQANNAKERPYFLTVGTIEPRKNHLTILKAFESFCQSNTDFDLVIIGREGWMNSSFKTSLINSPFQTRIHYKSYVDRDTLWQNYRNAHAFIFASFYEGFGLPVLEAMSFGLPLIVANNSSLSELVAGHGLMFQANLPHELQACLDQMLDETTRKELCEKSSRRYQALENKNRSLDFLGSADFPVG